MGLGCSISKLLETSVGSGSNSQYPAVLHDRIYMLISSCDDGIVPGPTVNRIEQLIKQHMPVGAVGYYFQLITADNQVLRFPERGCFKLIAPFQRPVGVPNGTYQVFFVRSLDETQPLAPRDPEYPYPEVPFYFAPSPATHAPVRPQEQPRREPTVSDTLEDSAEMREALVDYRKQQMVMRLKQEEMRVTKSQSYTHELENALELNRAYRHELADSAKSMSSIPQRLAEDMMRMMEACRQMNELSLDMIAKHRQGLEALANPAPPPLPSWLVAFNQIMPALMQFGAIALASTKFGAAAPPELIKALSASLVAMTPVAPPPALTAAPKTAPLSGSIQSTPPLPSAQPQPLAVEHQAPPPPAGAELPELPPLADGALTVQDLHAVLSFLQGQKTPEAQGFLSVWINLADRLNPERVARRQAASAVPGTPAQPQPKPS